MKKAESLGDFIERLEKKLPIVEYLSKYTEVVGERAKCPFHYTDHFGMRLTQGSGMWECYECGCSGLSLISFIMLWHKKSFYTVLQELSKETGIEIPKNIQNEITFFTNRQKY